MANFRELVTMSLIEAVSSTLLRAIQARYTKVRGVIGEIQEYPADAPLNEKRRIRMALIRSSLEDAKEDRKLAFSHVISMITRPEFLQVYSDPDRIIVGAGYIPALDEIRAPSATPLIHGRPSRSPYGILWRQMEFGMGVLMRKTYPLPIANTRSTSGQGWWYGPKTPKAGVHFKGTPPGNILRSQSGLPYAEDSLKFRSLFNQQLRKLFRG